MTTLSKFLPISLILTLALAACGENPVTVGKDRDRADKQRRDAESNNTQLEEKNAQLVRVLKTAHSTTNGLWVLAEGTEEYQKAVSICESLGFSLPTKNEIVEYKSEVQGDQTPLQKTPLERFFKKDVVQDQKGNLGIVLCRRGRAPATVGL